MGHSILIVEDDKNLREAIGESLELSGYEISLAENGEEAMKIISKASTDFIISDVQMPGMDGHVLLNRIRKEAPHIPFLLMTAHAEVHQAVAAMRGGAIDYLTKPFEAEVLIEKIKKYLPESSSKGNKPVAADPQSKQIFALAMKVAETDATVLISGESGTGKEVLDRFIHDNSPRNKGPFVAINCAAIPETMLEATLFGYEKGSFTGAYKATPGKFEQAQQGTLLLDEISEMDLSLQAKLLRVLQEQEVERIGSQKPIALDVRILATTNRHLQEEVKNGRFREDLYYRLNVFPLKWLPLRERRGDIIPLAEYLLRHHCFKSQRPLPKFSEAAIAALMNHPWQGNAREMDNVIQRALILKEGDVIERGDLNCENSLVPSEEGLSQDLKKHEHAIIQEAMQKYRGNRKKVAEFLGVSERTLRYKLARLRELGLDFA